MIINYHKLMDMLLIASGIATLLFSLIVGVFALYLGFKFFSVLTRDIDEEAEIKENNIAVAVLAGAFIFSIGNVLKTTVDPMIQTLFNILSGSYSIGLLLLNIGIMLLQFGLALVIGTLMLWLGIRIFMNLNHNIREFAEIRKNNIAVAIITASIVITLSLFISGGLEKLLQTIVITPGIDNAGLKPFG